MIHGRKITMRVAQKMNNDLIVSEQKAKAIMGASMDALVEINKKGEIIEWGGISEKIF